LQVVAATPILGRFLWRGIQSRHLWTCRRASHELSPICGEGCNRPSFLQDRYRALLKASIIHTSTGVTSCRICFPIRPASYLYRQHTNEMDEVVLTRRKNRTSCSESRYRYWYMGVSGNICQMRYGIPLELPLPLVNMFYPGSSFVFPQEGGIIACAVPRPSLRLKL
jgi:hypothetical protein